MLEKFAATIVKFSHTKRSLKNKIVMMLFGAINLLVVIPFVFFQVGCVLEKYILVHWLRLLEIVTAILSVLWGLFFLIWSVTVQIHLGKGTPIPLAPTQNLIITGPYKLCHNPMHLGAMIYYFGVGTWFGSLTIGIMSFLLGLVLFSFYNKFFEEKELLLRFGKEYEEYKRKTSFLIPKLCG